MKSANGFIIAAAVSLAVTGQAAARDQIRIVGSSTVFPYTQAVAEEFANQSGSPSPVVESTGTGGGMKIFCQGVGEAYPDVTGASPPHEAVRVRALLQERRHRHHRGFCLAMTACQWRSRAPRRPSGR